MPRMTPAKPKMSQEEFLVENERVRRGISTLAEGRRLKAQLCLARKGLLSPAEMEQFRTDLERFKESR